MASLDELRARVAVGYDGLGMPAWPDPHPGGAEPRDEDYSRLTEPERYGIVHARARVWADQLRAMPGVEVETLAPGPTDDRGSLGRFDRGVRLTSHRPDTLAVLLLERDAPLSEREGSLAVLHIGAVQPEFTVQTLPDCGCDACDRGSDDLLGTIDETVGILVGGPFVVLRGPGWHAQWHPEGGSLTATGPNFSRTMELCRRLAAGEDVPLPDGAEAFVGHSWFPNP